MIYDSYYSLFDAQKLVDDFENLLKQYGITIEQNSELERLCLNVVDVIEKHVKPNLRKPDEDIRPYLREFLGLQDLITKIIKAKDHPNFRAIVPHLNKLNVANALQNVKTSVLNAENNKILELYIATLCMKMSAGVVAVDDPNLSKGDNPDIIAQIGSRKWGFGCKALHSNKTQTIYDNLEKAVDQIEKSPADIGLPILSIKNIIDHDAYWRYLGTDPTDGAKLFEAFLDITIPFSKVYSFTSEIQRQLVADVGHDNLASLFKGKKCMPACLIYCATATSIVIGGSPVPTRLNTFNLLTFSNFISSECQEVLIMMNHQLQLP